MPHTLDSVLVLEGLRLARRHHIFRILRSMAPMETETQSRKRNEALRRKTKSYEVLLQPDGISKSSGTTGVAAISSVKANQTLYSSVFLDIRPTSGRFLRGSYLSFSLSLSLCLCLSVFLFLRLPLAPHRYSLSRKEETSRKKKKK